MHWSSTGYETAAVMRAPAGFYLRSLETQLGDFKAQIPGALLDNRMSILSYVLLFTKHYRYVVYC